MDSNCVIHYKGVSTPGENLLPITAEKHRRLTEAAEARVELGGANTHEAQCKGIPITFLPGCACHQSCYKKFTMAISLLKKKVPRKLELDSPPTARKKSRSEYVKGTVLFPKHCMHPDCLSAKEIKYRGERQNPEPLYTNNACETVFQAAEQLGDEEMLTKIRGVDLIAKEFRMHRKCHRDYTRAVSANRRAQPTDPATEYVNHSSADRLEELQNFVQENKIENGRSISLRLLTEVYGFDPDDNRYRGKVKEKLQFLFPGQLIFLTVDYHEVQIVISLKSVTNVDAKEFVRNNERLCFDRVSERLQREMDSLLGNSGDLPWPPTPEALRRPDRQPPELLTDFILSVLHCKRYHHLPGTEVKRFAHSLSQDILFCYSGGSFLTKKHVMLGTGLHSITGQKVPVSILARFGHCIKYDTIRAIEAGQAEVARNFSEGGYELPLVPKSDHDFVPTIFWWDNYDESKENQSGGIHTTHLIGWQEPNEVTTTRAATGVDVGKSRGYHARADVLPHVKINPHTAPPALPDTESVMALRENDKELFLWKALRFYHRPSNQVIPRYIGHIIERYSNPARPKTVMTFLPPIMRPITDYCTVTECIHQSQKMAEHCNLKYVQIVVDVGAASKFLHVVWNNPETLKNVIIHLGDMHAFMENFSIIGKFLEGSGFEEIVFQSGEAQSGTIRGILSGKHYNRAWTTHETFAEAINRFFMGRYMEKEMCELSEFIAGLPEQTDISDALLRTGKLDEIYQRYNSLKTECLSGSMGLTPQYWMMYVDMMDKQHTMHAAINLNDFEARLTCWREFLPFYFTMNKTNYARYGTYYCQQMLNLDQTHAGAREEFTSVSICRNDYGIGQSIDAGGEQTFMRSAKTTGGIRNLSNRPDSYEKWVRNRPYAAQMVEGLTQLADMDSKSNPRKNLRPSQIEKSENMVRSTMQTLNQYFIMPFDDSLEPKSLLNLISGKPLDSAAAESLLSSRERGIVLVENFTDRLNYKDGAKAFFDPIPRVPWKSFKDGMTKTTVNSKNGKVKDIALQRDILGILAAKSFEMDKPIDFKAVLSYPLAPIPLSLASSDGTRRKTVKSKLMEAIATPSSNSQPSDQNAIYILDVMAQIRSMVNVPDTFRKLARRLLKDIPQRYKVIYLACDRYDQASIKNAEHTLRASGNSVEYTISKPDMKIPDFTNFLKSGKNKQQMLESIKEVLVDERDDLGNRVLYFTLCSQCFKINSNGTTVIDDLTTDHIEADTMIAYLAKHALSQNGGDVTTCLIRSPSGDIDIPIILLNIDEPNLRIYLDNGTGKVRTVLEIFETALTPPLKSAIVGFHAFTGNDYNSSFFFKGKLPLWDKIKGNEKALDAFRKLGMDVSINKALKSDLEKVVCLFYGQKKTNSVNEARYNIFWTNYKRGKIIDLCFLPPCETSLFLHSMRANYIARMWRKAATPLLSMSPVTEHGWNKDFSIKWIETAYPRELSDLLIQIDENTGLEMDRAFESDLDSFFEDDEMYSIEEFAAEVCDDLP